MYVLGELSFAWLGSWVSRQLGEDAEGREKKKSPTSIEKTLGREGQAGILRRLDENCQYPKVNLIYSFLPSRTLQ